MGAVLHWQSYTHDERVFHFALAASLVLHALLLFALPGLREGQTIPQPPGVLVARIVAPPPAPVITPLPQVTRPVEPPKPHLETPPKLPPIRKPSPIAEPAPAPQPAPRPEPTPQAIPAEQPPVAVTSAPVAPVEQALPYQGSLKDYEAQLSYAAGRYKFYPRVAMDNAWEGNVEVEIDIGANGVLRSVKVKTSSGHNVLDQQAIEMFKRAKPLVPIPPALAGRQFTVTRLVTFKLTQNQ